jgi:hypothetical protein
MPRNASGTYTLPSGNPVVSGTLIDATWANNTLSDLGNEVTDSLSRSGEGAMLAPLRITDGVQATPALAFSNEPSSGLYRAGSNEWWAVAAGVQNLRFTNTGLTTRAAAGAVGTPSIAAFNDTDTGIYFPGANELAIATGGVGALWVNSSQNVGVGASSPAYKFHVERPSYGVTGYFFANDGTRNPRLVVYGSSSGTTIQHTFSTGADSLIFAVGGAIGTGTEVARFVDGGDFGIGTNGTPSSRLDVRGQETTNYNTVVFGNGTDNQFFNFLCGRALTNGTSAGVASSLVMTLRSSGSVAGVLAFATGNDECGRFDQNGNLGIGTASPAHKLQVVGTQRIEKSGAGYEASMLSFSTLTETSAIYRLGMATGGNFTIGRSDTSTTNLTLDASGNLLVGATANPNVLNTSVVIDSGASSLAGIVLQNNTTGRASTDGSHVAISGADLKVVNLENAPIIFATNGIDRAQITGAGNFVAGASAALATTATNGFLYVPTCAGTPTGVPTSITGMAPIVVNTTNNKLYFYSGGSWRDAGP